MLVVLSRCCCWFLPPHQEHSCQNQGQTKDLPIATNDELDVHEDTSIVILHAKQMQISNVLPPGTQSEALQVLE
ncbi:endoplasmic reticulum aminopeptidase 1b isoform X1 [Lates japonicus]|uniref:Endoplasmic reticulum aminopeptidase 1b isoform X1 n=1 Tax=Lates japonicus TaxID=270547 RepID=A0AAD3NN10_LATJO|nr:endoplasmic reticulum aminopeptidase 1b isoform X1 [Lates japonicus]